MKQKIDSPKGRHHYSKRLGIVEPVFGNINTTIGIKRFSLRGKNKVNGQWQLMTMIHNILKIHRYGWEWAKSEDKRRIQPKARLKHDIRIAER